MARSHPGQLSLFDDFRLPGALLTAAAGANAATADDTAPEASGAPDSLLLAVLLGGKSAGAILAIGESLATRHGLTDHLLVSDLFHIPLLHLGSAEDIEDEELDHIAACGDGVDMLRFALTLTDVESQIGTEGLHPVVVGLQSVAELDLLADMLRASLRERGLGYRIEAGEGPMLVLGESPSLVPHAPLARTVEVPVREFALVRHVASEGRHELLRKWTLAV